MNSTQLLNINLKNCSLVLGSRSKIYLFIILTLQAFLIPVFAEENNENSNSIILETDKPEYQIGEVMLISGLVGEKKMPVVALQIFDPDGGILSANQVDVEDDNTFSKTISLDSPFYDIEGTYSITLNYGKLKTQTNFDIVSEDSSESDFEDDYDFLFPEIIAMFTDREVYHDGDIVTIFGLVSEKDEESVLIGIYDPFGTPTGFYFADIDSNQEFSVSFLVKAGVNFKTEGIYSISAFYGDSEYSTNFDFVEEIEDQNPIEEKEQNDDAKSLNYKDKILNDRDVQEPKSSNKIEKKENKKIPQANPAMNLSVEDIELGIMLNQINSRCDTNEFVDTISYYDSMGPALIRLCKYDEAIYYYDQSLIKEPDNIEILTNKGSALSKMGFYDEAIIHYDSALSIKPNNFLALNNKANALANLGNYEDAISLYDKALVVAPSNTIVQKNHETAKDKLVVSKNDNIQEPDETRILEQENNLMRSNNQENNLIRSNNQETISIFDQIGNILSSFFSFLS